MAAFEIAHELNEMGQRRRPFRCDHQDGVCPFWSSYCTWPWCYFSPEAWASAHVSGAKRTSLSHLNCLSGCRLHSTACKVQPGAVGRLSVHSWRTEVRSRREHRCVQMWSAVWLKLRYSHPGGVRSRFTSLWFYLRNRPTVKLDWY